MSNAREWNELRVLEIIASVDPRDGGAIEGLIQQAAVRRRIGVQTSIVSLDSPTDAWVSECPVPTIALGNGRHHDAVRPHNWLWTQYRYAPSLRRWLRSHAEDYDIAVVNGLWNYTALAARQALPARIPYVVFAHGMLDPWEKHRNRLKHTIKQMLWSFSEGPLLENASAVLFTAEDEMLRARETFWPYRVKETIVGYGTADIAGDPQCQIDAFRRSLPSLGDRPFLLFLGRIHPKKGCDLLISSFAKVAALCPRLDVVIAGPDQIGWRKQLEALAQAEGVAERIHWPGPVFGEIKWGALRACAAFVLPSHQENFGVAVAEALAAGKPVMISDKVNIWREVEADGAGLIASDDAAGTLASLSKYISLSLEQRQAMGMAARGCFLHRYEISVPAVRLCDLFNTIIGEQTHHPAPPV